MHYNFILKKSYVVDVSSVLSLFTSSTANKFEMVPTTDDKVSSLIS